jgi:hypothetical protein
MCSFLSVDFEGLKKIQIDYQVGTKQQTEKQGDVNPLGGSNVSNIYKCGCAEREDDLGLTK